MEKKKFIHADETCFFSSAFYVCTYDAVHAYSIVFITFVDSIYVSRLGTDALTAVSLAYPLQNAILSAAVGIGVGISSAISIHLGAGNREKADRAATLGIALTLIHCIFFIIAGLTISEPFLKLFTDNPKILNDASIYTEIVLCLLSALFFKLHLKRSSRESVK
mgnify:CR=1 FL=1